MRSLSTLPALFALVLAQHAGAQVLLTTRGHSRATPPKQVPNESTPPTPGTSPVSNSGALDLPRIDPAASLRGVSLLLVDPPKPRTLVLHDKITIIISETSRQSANQTLDTKDDAAFKAQLSKFPDLMKFLELNLKNSGSSPIVEASATGNTKFKGEGKYSRDDRFNDRVTATIIDVKPNGTLVIEAKRVIKKDEEVQTLTLAGECRREDVTDANTVLSSQLAELTVATRNEGRVKDSATKGIIPRLFEAIFNW